MTTSVHRYTLVGGAGKEGSRLVPWHGLSSRRLPFCTVLAVLGALLSIVCVGGIGFQAGRYTSRGDGHSALQLDTVSRVWKYNRTFGEIPSPDSDRAWAELFPEQGGYFKHPTIAPERSVFSVYHQLHCLNGIREGYWAVFLAAIEGRKIVEDDLPMMSSPPHIRHCIDLIRNSLMCQPDLTVEAKDDALGGVNGFGTEHQCKDWDQLVRWSTEWQTYGQNATEHALKAGHEHKGHNHTGHDQTGHEQMGHEQMGHDHRR